MSVSVERAERLLDLPKLREVVERLVHTYDPVSVYLFGSHARGEAGPNSDYDLLVLVSDSASPERRSPTLGYRALFGTGIAVDLLVWRLGSFAAQAKLQATLPWEVERHGVLLYDG